MTDESEKDKPVIFEFRKGAGIVNVIPSPAQIIDTRPESSNPESKEETH